MSVGKWIKVGAVSALSLAASTVASAADYVILDSNAVGIEPGIVVAGTATIDIPGGAQVIFIDPEGETLVVAGPFSGAVQDAGASKGASGALEGLTSSRGEDTTVLGAVRAPTVDGGSVTE